MLCEWELGSERISTGSTIRLLTKETNKCASMARLPLDGISAEEDSSIEMMGESAMQK